MKQRNRSETALSVLILVVFALVGCVTRPPSEDVARAGALRCPSPGERMAFPAQNFSIISPPADWHCKEDDAGLNWVNNETGSTIIIRPGNPMNLGLSRDVLAELFTSALGIVLRDEFQGAKVTLAEEKDVSFNGKPFYQVTMNVETRSQDIQIKLKTAMYFPTFETFEYWFALVSLTGQYEKNHLIIEQMLGGPTAHAPPTTPIKIGGSLHEAAAKGDLEQIKQLITEGANVNESNAGFTPLYVAVYKRRETSSATAS